MTLQKSKPDTKNEPRKREAEREQLKRWSRYLGVTEEELRAAIKTVSTH